eukprot:CAMPEP_0206260490 /NCGR_PEP_ID=MMETSP0047_2-20121206/27124_1 /ASSEMBLY_ACC=CAM_ASM_000192 /TAXON_ID=195065 /ORGANISM="Chroomonas mesostigmatica_cf, Strain CCMP1168" /LENGTH=70 /DNA_ID=CAMNT_0053687591 /DNA_START=40 /DNA_END=248 /DNA_ORIENTATION=+
MYMLSLKNLTVTSLTNIASNLAGKVLFPQQIMAFARYGGVAAGFGLWFTHPYGVMFIQDAYKEITNPTPP